MFHYDDAGLGYWLGVPYGIRLFSVARVDRLRVH
jgi:hypothetical protein